MSAKCVWVEGVLLRVDASFDATPGSEDMVAAAELVSHLRSQIPPAADDFVTNHGRRP